MMHKMNKVKNKERIPALAGIIQKMPAFAGIIQKMPAFAGTTFMELCVRNILLFVNVVEHSPEIGSEPSQCCAFFD